MASSTAPAPPLKVAAMSMSALSTAETIESWRASLRCGLAVSVCLCLSTLVCGVAGTFTPLMGSQQSAAFAASVGNFSTTFTFSSAFLNLCEASSCAVSSGVDTIGFCAYMTAAVPTGCFSSAGSAPTQVFSGIVSMFGTSQLQGGLATAIIAWLFDVLALCILGLCVADLAVDKAAVSRGALADSSRLPAALGVTALSIILRCVALGLGVNFAFTTLGGSGPTSNIGAVAAAQFPNTVAIVAGSPTYGFWPTTGTILLFIALALQIVGFCTIVITRVFVLRCSERHAPAIPAPRIAAAAVV